MIKINLVFDETAAWPAGVARGSVADDKKLHKLYLLRS